MKIPEHLSRVISQNSSEWFLLKVLQRTKTCSMPLAKKPLELLQLRILTGKKAPLNKTTTLSKSMNTDIWVVGRSTQNFRKNEVVAGKIPLFVVGPFYAPHSICLNIDF